MHAIHLLLCTTTNETPHEILFFNFHDKLCLVLLQPPSLPNSELVLLCCILHNDEPVCGPVMLLSDNPP